MGTPRFDIIGQLPALRRYSRSLTRDATEAEDLVHDALLRAYDRRSTFRVGARPLPWLLSILHSTFIDGLRSRRAAKRREDGLAREVEDGYAPSQEHAVRLGQVRKAFEMLPDDQRAALHLVAIEGLSYQDAAEALDVPVGTVMSRIGRARAALRAMEDAVPERPVLRIVGGQDD